MHEVWFDIVWNLPAAQSVQVRSMDELPLIGVMNVPALQVRKLEHVIWSLVDVYMFAPQFMHVRSVEVVPLSEMYLPATQVILSMHVSEFVVVLYLVLEQGVQSRSLVTAPWSLMNSPCWHVVIAVQSSTLFIVL